MLEMAWQDLVIGMGSFVGLATKLYALYDKDTRWPRRSSVTNSVMFLPSIVAFYTLELYLTTILTTASFILWTLIAIFRPKKDDD